MIRKANLKQEGFKVMGEIIIPQGYKSALNLHYIFLQENR